MMNVRRQVLITGLGGDLGQALVKALRLSASSFQIHGSDINNDLVGRAAVDDFHILPAADKEEYVAELECLCKCQDIEAIIPGSEPELLKLSGICENSALPIGIPIVALPGKWVKRLGDKLSCMRFLDGKIPLAGYADGTNESELDSLLEGCDAPLVVKERFSSGSKNIKYVNDRTRLKNVIEHFEAPLVQAQIDDSEGEYSVGVFSCDRFTAVHTFRRRLGPGGCSWHAETNDDPSVEKYCRKIASHCAIYGSYNIQVRKSKEGVRLLEINPRFSSLVAARALSNFSDLEWAINQCFGCLDTDSIPKTRRITYQRYLSEVVDLGGGPSRVASWSFPMESISNGAEDDR